MANTRVVYISEITAGSKFRVIANRSAALKKAATSGIKWASCQVNDSGGNFQRPSFRDTSNPIARAKMVLNPTFGWIKAYPPKFNIFNRPCPRAIHYKFGDAQSGQGYSFFQ
jgi:hypothetical protein